MSLMPRKKPEGLIDGCWGPSQYCSKCNYAKEWPYGDDYLCKSCRAMESIAPETKMVIQIIEDDKKNPLQTD